MPGFLGAPADRTPAPPRRCRALGVGSQVRRGHEQEPHRPRARELRGAAPAALRLRLQLRRRGRGRTGAGGDAGAGRAGEGACWPSAPRPTRRSLGAMNAALPPASSRGSDGHPTRSDFWSDSPVHRNLATTQLGPGHESGESSSRPTSGLSGPTLFSQKQDSVGQPLEPEAWPPLHPGFLHTNFLVLPSLL